MVPIWKHRQLMEPAWELCVCVCVCVHMCVCVGMRVEDKSWFTETGKQHLRAKYGVQWLKLNKYLQLWTENSRMTS